MDGLISCAIVRLTRDPEKRYTQAGKALLNLNGVVVDAKAEEGKDTWLKVTVFGDKAESLADQVQKGAECYVEGRLKLAKWQSREGAERSGLELLAWRVDPLGQIGRRGPQRQPLQRSSTAASEVEDLEDAPF